MASEEARRRRRSRRPRRANAAQHARSDENDCATPDPVPDVLDLGPVSNVAASSGSSSPWLMAMGMLYRSRLRPEIIGTDELEGVDAVEPLYFGHVRKVVEVILQRHGHRAGRRQAQGRRREITTMPSRGTRVRTAARRDSWPPRGRGLHSLPKSPRRRSRGRLPDDGSARLDILFGVGRDAGKRLSPRRPGDGTFTHRASRRLRIAGTDPAGSCDASAAYAVSTLPIAASDGVAATNQRNRRNHEQQERDPGPHPDEGVRVKAGGSFAASSAVTTTGSM